VTGKITYRDDKDGLTYEWDDEKKAWFPALGEDFMAMYQLNYGFTKYVPVPVGSYRINMSNYVVAQWLCPRLSICSPRFEAFP